MQRIFSSWTHHKFISAWDYAAKKEMAENSENTTLLVSSNQFNFLSKYGFNIISLDDETIFQEEGYTLSFGGSSDNISLIIRKIILDLFKEMNFKNINFNYKLSDIKQIDEILDMI